MDESEKLRNFYTVGFSRPAKPGSNKTTKLGDVVKQLVEERISPQQANFVSIAQLWSQLLPVELWRHCEIADMRGGQLKVLVDSPSYMHELRLCSSQLLEQLQQWCPQARIRRIKFAIGRLDA